MPMKRFYGAVFLIALLFLCGCPKEAEKVLGDDFFRAPDVTPVRKVLTAAMPLGYAANLTMAALKGAHPPNVTILRNGSDTSTGCFLVRISVDNAFPLPGHVQATGNIITAGFSVDNKTAIMTAVFTDLNILQGSFSIRDISTFPVVSDSDVITGAKELLVVYSDIDVNSGSDTLLTTGITQSQKDAEIAKFRKMETFDSGVSITENAWIIRVEDNSTLSDAFDDRYTISGGGQYVEVSDSKSEIVQLTMINASMSPTCKSNPGNGWALWQNLGVNSGIEIGHVFMTFHNTCDGNAKITVATGVYSTSFGRQTALRLGE